MKTFYAFVYLLAVLACLAHLQVLPVVIALALATWFFIGYAVCIFMRIRHGYRIRFFIPGTVLCGFGPLSLVVLTELRRRGQEL